VAQRLRYPAKLKSGETCRFELTLTNVGFATTHLPREVAFGLTNGDRQPARRVILKNADPRRWGPEAGTITIQGAIPVPTDWLSGKGRLMILLADPSPSLHDDGRYAIRLANQDIHFDDQTGWNILVDNIALN
jgi:hypothetical protein